MQTPLLDYRDILLHKLNQAFLATHHSTVWNSLNELGGVEALLNHLKVNPENGLKIFSQETKSRSKISQMMLKPEKSFVKSVHNLIIEKALKPIHLLMYALILLHLLLGVSLTHCAYFMSALTFWVFSRSFSITAKVRRGKNQLILKEKFRAIREGKQTRVSAHQILIGQILILEPGNIIHFNCVLLKLFTQDIKILAQNQRIQTKLPPNKHNAQPDCFMRSGDRIMQGQGLAVICGIISPYQIPLPVVSSGLEEGFQKLKNKSLLAVKVVLISVTIWKYLKLFLGQVHVVALLEIAVYSLSLWTLSQDQSVLSQLNIRLQHHLNQLIQDNVTLKIETFQKIGCISHLYVGQEVLMSEEKLLYYSEKESVQIFLQGVKLTSEQNNNKLQMLLLKQMKTQKYEFRDRNIVSILNCRMGRLVQVTHSMRNTRVFLRGERQALGYFNRKISSNYVTKELTSQKLQEIRLQFQRLKSNYQKVYLIGYLDLDIDKKLQTQFANPSRQFVYLGMYVGELPVLKKAAQEIKKLERLGVQVVVVTKKDQFYSTVLGQELKLLKPNISLNDQVISGSVFKAVVKGYKHLDFPSGKTVVKSLLGFLDIKNKIRIFCQCNSQDRKALVAALRQSNARIASLSGSSQDNPAFFSSDIRVSSINSLNQQKQGCCMYSPEPILSVALAVRSSQCFYFAYMDRLVIYSSRLVLLMCLSVLVYTSPAILFLSAGIGNMARFVNIDYQFKNSINTISWGINIVNGFMLRALFFQLIIFASLYFSLLLFQPSTTTTLMLFSLTAYCTHLISRLSVGFYAFLSVIILSVLMSVFQFVWESQASLAQKIWPFCLGVSWSGVRVLLKNKSKYFEWGTRVKLSII